MTLDEMLEEHFRMTAAVEAAVRFLFRTMDKKGAARVSEARAFLERRYPDVALETAMHLVRERTEERCRRSRYRGPYVP